MPTSGTRLLKLRWFLLVCVTDLAQSRELPKVRNAVVPLTTFDCHFLSCLPQPVKIAEFDKPARFGFLNGFSFGARGTTKALFVIRPLPRSMQIAASENLPELLPVTVGTEW